MNTHTADLVNSAVELVGGVLVWLNVKELLKDRNAQGVSIATVSFFTAWDVWHMLYYGTISQPMSLVATFCGLTANLSWLAIYAILCTKKSFSSIGHSSQSF